MSSFVTSTWSKLPVKSVSVVPIKEYFLRNGMTNIPRLSSAVMTTTTSLFTNRFVIICMPLVVRSNFL